MDWERDPRDLSLVFEDYKDDEEGKVLDTALSSTVVASTGTVMYSSVVLIPEGSGDGERVGRAVRVQRGMFRGVIYRPEYCMRLIFFVDKQCNGAAVSVTDVLETASVHSFMNMSNADRFDVLYDEYHYGEGNAYTGYYEPVDVRLELNLPVQYTGALASIANLSSVNVGCIAVGYDSSCTLEGNFRVVYSD